MGNSSSAVAKSFSTNISQNLSNKMIERVRNSQGAVIGTQSIKIKNINCTNVNIGDISQKMVTKFNFSRIAETMDTETLKADLMNAVDQAAKADADVEAEFGAIATSSHSNVETHSTNISQVVSNYTHKDFTNDLNTARNAQEVGISDISGENCNIGNISQNIYLEMIVKQMSVSLTKGFQALQAKNATTQEGDAKAKTKATGPIGDLLRGVGGVLESAGTMVGNIFKGPVLLIVGIILFVVMIGMIIKMFSGGSASPEAAMLAMQASQDLESLDEYDDDYDVLPPTAPPYDAPPPAPAYDAPPPAPPLVVVGEDN
jgi:predicted amino acid-binding ACT domain protein